MVSVYVRRQLPISIVYIVTAIVLVNYFTGSLGTIVANFTAYGLMVSALLIITASISYVIRTVYDILAWRRASPEERKKYYIVENIYALILYFVLVVVYLAYGSSSSHYVFVITRILRPSWMAGIAYTASFIAIGIAYHWRVRSVETALFAFATIMALAARTPLIGAIAPWLSDAGLWMETYLFMPVARVFTLVAGLGSLMMLMNALRGKTAGFE